MGSWDSGETKVNPHWAQDPPWSFNGPCHGPTIHQTWPFIYWLYFCILCKKWVQGTLGTQRSTLIWSRTHLCPSMDPAMALKYTQHGHFILSIFLHSMQQKWDHWTLGRQRSTLIGSKVPGSVSFCDCYFFLVGNMPLNFLTFL